MGLPSICAAPELKRSALKLANEAAAPFTKRIRTYHRRFMERAFVASLSSSEFVLLSAIVSKTFGWDRLADIIPLSEFANGYRQAGSNELVLTPDGVPVFAGTRLQVKTIANALEGLLERGMISRFQVQTGGRPTYAYAPLGMISLNILLRTGGVYRELPADFQAILDDAHDNTDVYGSEDEANFCRYAVKRFETD